MSSSMDGDKTSPTTVDGSRRTAARVVGIASTALSTVGILPVVFVFALGMMVDPSAAWLFVLALPFSALLGGIAVVLGIIGAVFATRAGGGYLWPVIGLVLGGGQLLWAWNLTMASCEDRHVSGSSSLYGWSSPLLPGRTHGLTCRTP